METCSQFHQRFSRAFFVQIFGAKLKHNLALKPCGILSWQRCAALGTVNDRIRRIADNRSWSWRRFVGVISFKKQFYRTWFFLCKKMFWKKILGFIFVENACKPYRKIRFLTNLKTTKKFSRQKPKKHKN